MSKYANAGELRTPVYFKKVDSNHENENGYPVDPEEVNIFGKDEQGNDIPSWGKWVNAHGAETLLAQQLDVQEPVTFTTRYSPLYSVDLIAYLKSDVDSLGSKAGAFEVTSIDNVENRNIWLEIKLQRKVPAR